MIPIKLTMQAFGPYKSKEEIDFTKFYDSKLFLITGNTGSGKTMIFDGICYALFGETSGQDRKVDTLRSQFSDNKVITYVEFEFYHKDKKYIIGREPEQIKFSRGKEVTHRATAKLIVEDDVITGLKNVNKEIREILGIDYSQFKQIVMIAQGEFRKLVSADSKERESIYRKIFNTMNFERIQNMLKEKFSQAQNKVSLLSEKIKGILGTLYFEENISYEEMLLEDILKFLEDKIQTYNEKMKDVSINKEKLREEINRKNILHSKLRDLRDFKNQFKNLNIDKLKEEASYLNNVKKTFEIIDKENVLITLKGKYEESLKEREFITKDLEIYKEDLENLKKELKERENDSLEIQNLYSKILELEGLKVSLDEKLEIEKKFLDYDSQITSLKNQEEKLLNEIGNLEIKKQEMINFEKENSHITSKIFDLENEIKYLEDINLKIVKYEDGLNLYNQTKKNYEEIIPIYDEIFKIYREKLNELNEYEEIYLRNQVGILSKKLVEGTPCMVCGSTNHPNKAEMFNEEIDESKLKSLRNEFKNIELKREEISNNTIKVKNELSFREDNLKERFNYINFQEDKFIKFNYLESSISSQQNIEEVIKTLKNTLNESSSISEKISKNKDKIINVETNLKEVLKNHEDIKEKIGKIQIEMASLKTSLHEKSEKLLKFNIESKEDYTKILTNTKNNYEKLIKLNEELNQNLKKYENETLKLTTQLEIKDKQLLNFKEETKEKEEEFLKSIHENNFSNVEDYEKYKLPKEEFERRTNFLDEKRDEYKFLNTNISKLQRELNDHVIISEENFENNLLQLNKEFEEIEKNERNISNNFSQLNKAKDIIISLNKEISDQDKYITNLNELNKIANGNNIHKISFERYILGIYFKEIISAANIRFSKLTNGRFLFRHLKENFDSRIQQGLDISVFDNNTSSERKINTLSGGESFKASLSLALGLSDVVQRYSGGISIDTLFIDEGFGSLDSNSLQNALECLLDANDESKLIGIISHVQELKEIIKSKVEVKDSREGSKISISN